MDTLYKNENLQVKYGDGNLEFQVGKPRRWFLLLLSVFLLVVSSVILGLTLYIATAIGNEGIDLLKPRMISIITVFILGVCSLYILVRTFLTRETLRVKNQQLEISNGQIFSKTKHDLELGTLKNNAAQIVDKFANNKIKLLATKGKVILESNGKIYSFGQGLDDADAYRLRDFLNAINKENNMGNHLNEYYAIFGNQRRI